jgi:hypothetical protein
MNFDDRDSCALSEDVSLRCSDVQTVLADLYIYICFQNECIDVFDTCVVKTIQRLYPVPWPFLNLHRVDTIESIN